MVLFKLVPYKIAAGCYTVHRFILFQKVKGDSKIYVSSPTTFYSV